MLRYSLGPVMSRRPRQTSPRSAARVAALVVLAGAAGCGVLDDDDDGGGETPGKLFQGRWQGVCEMDVGGDYVLDVEFRGEDGDASTEGEVRAGVEHEDGPFEAEGSWETLEASRAIYLPVEGGRLDVEMRPIVKDAASIVCRLTVLDGPPELPECDDDSEDSDGDGDDSDDSDDGAGSGGQTDECAPRIVVAGGQGTLILDS